MKIIPMQHTFKSFKRVFHDYDMNTFNNRLQTRNWIIQGDQRLRNPLSETDSMGFSSLPVLLFLKGSPLSHEKRPPGMRWEFGDVVDERWNLNGTSLHLNLDVFPGAFGDQQISDGRFPDFRSHECFKWFGTETLDRTPPALSWVALIHRNCGGFTLWQKGKVEKPGRK